MWTKKHYYLFSLTSLTLLSASAYANQIATAPTLEGGVTASIGTFYVVPSSNLQSFAYTENGTDITELSANSDYEFGWEASLGYVFADTANSIELSYRGLDTNNTNTTTGHIGLLPPDGGAPYDAAHIKLGYKYNAADLMISQYLDIGSHVQMRLLGGLAYVDLKQTETVSLTTSIFEDVINEESKFNGWGPRIGADLRYDFGQGFGIVGGGSVAYFLGDLDTQATVHGTGELVQSATDNPDNHAVVNLRGNLGIDYVYFFDDEESTAGIELGYLVDYYRDAAAQLIDSSLESTTEINSVTFSGPYLSIKGAF